MRILATSDIHQMSSKWKSLAKTCKADKFDIVVVSGDLFPKDSGILEQFHFVKHLRKYAQDINNTGAKLIIMLGNDDNQNLIYEMEKGHNEDLWSYVPDKTIEINGYEFAGMPYVPDYPFGYKYWCRSEYKDNLRISPVQFMEPLLVNKDNKFSVIPDYASYLRQQKSIWDSLVDTASKIKDIKKSIWLIHAPPANFDLDVCARGEKVGSFAIYDFIVKYQPLLTIHGHIHESPLYNGHKWYHIEKDTLCIQSGQVDKDLYYSIIDVENGKIINKEHSIFHDYLKNI